MAILLFLTLWLTGFLVIWRVPVPESRRPATAALPAVSVVIPARNEAGNLPGLLDSLAAQGYPGLEVLVVDDHSTDGTGAVAGAGGAKVLISAPLPAGWCGKPWACWQGAQASSGELLLFLDADTRILPGGLSRLVATWLDRRGLVSVQPYHRIGGGHEQLAAFFNIVSLASGGSFGVQASGAPDHAFGPCNLSSRADYFTAGGHETALGAVVEGPLLARAYREKGFPVCCLGGKGSIEFRMYPENLQSLAAGFTKSTATGALAISPIRFALIAAWLTSGGEALRHLLESLISGVPTEIALWSAAYLLFARQFYWMLVQIGSFRRAIALLYPVPLAFFALVSIHSLLSARILRRVSWKGREIST